VAPIVLAFVGAAVDVASWWLTRAYGAPFQWGVIAGGAAFGAAIVWMSALSLGELWFGRRRVLVPPPPPRSEGVSA
jgi:hypothetical protein